MKDIILGTKIFESIDFPEEFGSQSIASTIFKPVNVIERYSKAITDLYDSESFSKFDMAGYISNLIEFARSNFDGDVDRDEILFAILDAAIVLNNKFAEVDNTTEEIIKPLLYIFLSKTNGASRYADLYKGMIRHILISDVKINKIGFLIKKAVENANRETLQLFFKAMITFAEKRKLQFGADDLITMYSYMIDTYKNTADKIGRLLGTLPNDEIADILNKEASKLTTKTVNTDQIHGFYKMLMLFPNVKLDVETINIILSIKWSQLSDQAKNDVWSIVHKSIVAIPDFELTVIPNDVEFISRLLPRIAKNKELLARVVLLSKAIDRMKERITKSGKFPLFDNIMITILKNSADDFPRATMIWGEALEFGYMFDPDKVFAAIPKMYYENIQGNAWVTILSRLRNQRQFQVELARCALKYGNKAKMKPDSIEKIKQYL
jgi:hypothetical protein